MKLVIAVVQDYDADRLLRRIVETGLNATRLASTGGFLRTGNTTLLLGVPDGAVPGALALVTETCGRRPGHPIPTFGPDQPELYAAGVAEAPLGGAVAFVANVSRFERLDHS